MKKPFDSNQDEMVPVRVRGHDVGRLFDAWRQAARDTGLVDPNREPTPDDFATLYVVAGALRTIYAAFMGLREQPEELQQVFANAIAQVAAEELLRSGVDPRRVAEETGVVILVKDAPPPAPEEVQ